MKENTIIIVSGLQRSGTSLMMQLLEESDLTVFKDEVRKADQDNPNGYYEHSAVTNLKQDSNFLKDCEGRGVKIYAARIPLLPKGYNYKVILMHRDLKSIMYSLLLIQKRKFPNTEPKIGTPFLFKLEAILKNSQRFINNQPNIELLNVNFEDLILDPSAEMEKVNEFLNNRLNANAKFEGIVNKEFIKADEISNTFRTDRAPIEIADLINEYVGDKVFCEIGIGEGDNLNSIKGAKKVFGIELNKIVAFRTKIKYPHLDVKIGNALDLLPDVTFDVCYMWIIYPICGEIINKILDLYPRTTIIFGFTYYYHLNENDPKFQQYIEHYPPQTDAKNWNNKINAHLDELKSQGHEVEVRQVNDKRSNEIFTVGIIEPNS